MRIVFTAAAIAIALLQPAFAAAQTPPSVAPQAARDRISFIVEGSGPDIILIPGLASSREVWAGLAERLRPHYRLHLAQLAGFAGLPPTANSDGAVAAPAAEAIADYIRRERIRAPVVIGHSLGGEVALMLGARHPELVGRLLIVDALPFYSLLLDPNATSESIRPRAAAFREAMLAAPATQADAMQAASIARLVKSEAARPALIAASAKSDRKTVADATYELMTTDLRPELSRIAVPVNVVYAYDLAYGAPASNIDAIFRTAYASTPNIRFDRIDGSFHFVMIDQPEMFGRTVADILGGAAPTTKRR